MSDYRPKAPPAGRGVTLNSLRDQLYSLNMRLLLAVRSRDVESQGDIRRQMAEVQREIDRMGPGGGRRP